MAIVLFGATIAGAAETVNFDGDFIGGPPKGWALTMTGKGTPKWTVERDETAPSKGLVLKQSGKATYPLALKDGTSVKDGFVETKFKAIAGSRIARVVSSGEPRMRTTTTSCVRTHSRTTSCSTRPSTARVAHWILLGRRADTA